MVNDMKKIIFFLVIIILIFTRVTTSDEVDESLKVEDEEYNQVSLIAVGDNLIHSSIYEAAKVMDEYDFKPMLGDVKKMVKQYDLRFINQETIIGGSEIGLSTYPAFNSPYEVGDAIVDAGFNLISLANNHILDRGEKAIKNTIKYWENQPVIYSGTAVNDVSHLKIFNMNNIKFAFVAYTYGTNEIKLPEGKEYLANIYSNEKARRDILSIRNMVDVVIVSMHWGEEYQDYPSRTQKDQALYLANMGADIIIGHHPHVIQPVEKIKTDKRETFVIYSLGNLLSDQKGIDRLIGMAVGLNIYKSNQTNAIKIKDYTATLLYRYKNQNKYYVKLFQDLNADYLVDYLTYFENKKNLIQTYYKDIEVK